MFFVVIFLPFLLSLSLTDASQQAVKEEGKVKKTYFPRGTDSIIIIILPACLYFFQVDNKSSQ